MSILHRLPVKWEYCCSKIWRVNAIALGFVFIFWYIPIFIVLFPFVILTRLIQWIKKIIFCGLNFHNWDIRQYTPINTESKVKFMYRTCRRCPLIEVRNGEDTEWLSIKNEPEGKYISWSHYQG